MPKLIDLTGHRFGRLLVVKQADTHRQPNGRTVVMWECVCDCGNTVNVAGLSLRSGVTKSCGCYNEEVRMANLEKAHKAWCSREETIGTTDRLYNIWANMLKRCVDENDPAYHYYGGRGIKICNDWISDYRTFKDWAYSTGYDEDAKRGECTLDRVDVNGDYCPQNCRWVDMVMQNNNKRNVKKYTYDNETHSISEWSRLTGIKYFTLRRRLLSGMSVERALNKGKYSCFTDLREIKNIDDSKIQEYIEKNYFDAL